METIISSRTKTVVIGLDRPFVVIGERINPTGRKQLGAEMAQGQFETVESDALAQVAAGAHILDVNAGIPLADEPAILAEAVRRVQQVTQVPLSIDSSVIDALKSGLDAYEGKPLVNSVTGEEERLESVLPLVKAHSAAVIGICNDESGISEDPKERFRIAEMIVERAEDHGIPREDVLIDPLAMPIGAIGNAGKALFEIARRCRDELQVNTVCGASNISFGLPGRPTLNGTFLAMAIASGMPCAITNPLSPEVRQAVLAADVMMGHDENCESWLTAHRGGSDRASRREARKARRGAAPRQTS
jgi:5-methyltetrahydrofolate--homocysteine methyltransferase